MDAKILFEKLFENNIQQLKDWKFDEIIGESLYKKYTGHYAFVKIKISGEEGCTENQYISCLNQNELPIEFVNEIWNTCNDFTEYFKEINFDIPFLKFELLDGTYHKIDSRISSFQTATSYAIKNAFDNSFIPISTYDLQSIINRKIENQ